MRTSSELFQLFHQIAASDERIRAMTLEGSRVNPNITPDIWQDYDLTFLVTDVRSFTRSDDWLSAFGDILLMQKPEAMALFPPGIPEGWFSYLMLFADGIKIDLTLVPLTDIQNYFRQDPLIRVLLDKDGVCPALPDASDKAFWVQRPSAAFIDDCANEFSLTCTYTARGLLRNELLFANWMFGQIARAELLRMLGYLAGARKGFPLNTGKHDKFLLQFLTDTEREKLLGTYCLTSVEAGWHAFYTAMDLFESAVTEVCATLACPCPDYVRRVTEYIELLKAMQ